MIAQNIGEGKPHHGTQVMPPDDVDVLLPGELAAHAALFGSIMSWATFFLVVHTAMLATVLFNFA